MFSFEYCEILKNTYFEKHLRTAASSSCVLLVSNQTYTKMFKLFLNIIHMVVSNRGIRVRPTNFLVWFPFDINILLETILQ